MTIVFKSEIRWKRSKERRAKRRECWNCGENLTSKWGRRLNYREEIRGKKCGARCGLWVEGCGVRTTLDLWRESYFEMRTKIEVSGRDLRLGEWRVGVRGERFGVKVRGRVVYGGWGVCGERCGCRLRGVGRYVCVAGCVVRAVTVVVWGGKGCGLFGDGRGVNVGGEVCGVRDEKWVE